MATKITAIQSALADLVETALDAGYRRIPNAYLLEANADLILEHGFGISVGPGERVSMEISRMTMRRLFNITLVRLVAATDHDVDSRVSVENDLLEDLQSVRAAVEANQSLGGLTTRADYESDSGLQFLIAQSVKFYALSLTISLVYDENY